MYFGLAELLLNGTTVFGLDCFLVMPRISDLVDSMMLFKSGIRPARLLSSPSARAYICRASATVLLQLREVIPLSSY